MKDKISWFAYYQTAFILQDDFWNSCNGSAFYIKQPILYQIILISFHRKQIIPGYL